LDSPNESLKETEILQTFKRAKLIALQQYWSKPYPAFLKGGWGDLNTMGFRVSAENNYTGSRRILVRVQGTPFGAYRDIYQRM
jgi:hypothetical protein